MTPERWHQVEGVFREALARSPSRRNLFLENACRDDSDLRREVQSLLASHEQAGSFLDAPVFHEGALAMAVDGKIRQAAIAIGRCFAIVHSFLLGLFGWRQYS